VYGLAQGLKVLLSSTHAGNPFRESQEKDRNMKNSRNRGEILRRAIVSGTVGGLAAATAASLAGKCEEGSYAAPLNATSHILWGDEAASKDRASLKYTLTGFLLNHGSAIFWAWFYEKLFGARVAGAAASSYANGRANGGANGRRTKGRTATPSLAQPILGAAAVAASAYVIDYHLIPKRFTPGFEKRVSGKSLAAIFATLAMGLAARDLIDAAKARRK
jgi:hypothetical protein